MTDNIKILLIYESDTLNKVFKSILKKEKDINFSNVKFSKKIIGTLSYKIDIIFIDIKIVDSLSPDIIKLIRDDANFLEIPIVMITDSQDEINLEKSFEAGAIDFISKPLNRITLKARIKAVLKLRKEIAKQRELSRFDPLTKLPNRLFFDEQLKFSMKKAVQNNMQIAVLVADLDHFKMVNDTFGHSAGDQLLVEVAKRMKECIRETDTISRMSGDEFFFILENIEQRSTVVEIVKRLVNSIKKPFVLDDNEAYIGLSIGICLSTKDISAEIILRNADVAMYNVKAHGRNNYKFFTQKMHNDLSKKVKLCTMLYDAIEKDEFDLNYQPKIDIKTNKIIGIEALLRWNHPGGENIPSDVFIPLLEEIGLINQIGNWVLEKACKQNSTWQAMGYIKIPISVNLSPLQFHDGKFADNIKKILKITQLDPEFFEIEINEGVFVVDDNIVKNTLIRIKQLGINKIIMDDFGSGYSSIGYLKKFPIDAIKIDKTFIQNITDNPGNAALVSAIAAMGIALQLKSIIAVGVEHEAQIPFLRHMGCDSYQGYLSCPPVCAEKIEKMLKEQSSDTPNNIIHNEEYQRNSNFRILFVDDFPTNIQIALKLLQNSGYKIDTAMDGEQAFTLFKQNGPYDLIFMDLQMPKLDGYETTKKIRKFETKAKVPIIAMTAYDMEGVKDRCFSAGMNDFIAKPFRLKNFIEVIENWKNNLVV